MHPAGFTQPERPPPAVFPVQNCPSSLHSGALVSQDGVPVGAPSSWHLPLKSVQAVFSQATGKGAPSTAPSSLGQTPPAATSSPAIPRPELPGQPSAPAFLPVRPETADPSVVVLDSSSSSQPISVLDSSEERARLLATARAKEGKDDEDQDKTGQHSNMRQLRLFIAETLPDYIPLPEVASDPTGATGSSIMDRSLLSSKRDADKVRELRKTLPLAPMVVAQADSLSAVIQGKRDTEDPAPGDRLEDLVNPECMDQIKRTFKVSSPLVFGLSTISYAMTGSQAGPKERLVESPSLDPNFESCGGSSYKDNPSDEEELARMGLRVMSYLDLLLAAAIKGAASPKEKVREMAADALEASLTATSHAATLFHRIAGNCELRRQESALR